MAFGHAQLLLYRPFLHYVSKSYQNNVDQRAFACASACVSISRNVVHISTEMRKRGLLAGSCWFSMYTTFFAIVSILYFVTENATSPNSFEILGDAVEGREVLAHFAKRSMAADRCISALKVCIRSSVTEELQLTFHRPCLRGYQSQSDTEEKLLNQKSDDREALHGCLDLALVFPKRIS